MTLDGFTPSPGTEIPKVDVRLAMWPYIDTTLSVIAFKNGWFEEVGISLPNEVATSQIPETFAQLVSRQVDVGSAAMSTNLQTYAEASDLKMFMVTNSYLGNYVMASPHTQARAEGDFAAEGHDFRIATKNALGQLSGMRVAFSENGSTPAFFNTALKLAGLTPNAFSMEVLDDAEIVERAKAGAIDYAVSGTATQSLELMKMGFYRIFGVTDMIDGLSAGDPDAVQGITHVGYRASESYLDANPETVLRFMAVQFRIIDALQQSPSETLSVLLPTVRAVTREDVSAEDALKLFRLFYVLANFEEAGQTILNPSHKLYYEGVYERQITAAKASGAMPKDLQVRPDDILTYKSLYQILIDLKHKYDDLESAAPPVGMLANQAAVHCKNRNYLDAYRLLSAVVNV